MITGTPANPLSHRERSDLDAIGNAIGVWREGRPEDALIYLEALDTQQMTPRVKAEYYIAESAFYIDLGDAEQCLRSLEFAAPFIDAAPAGKRSAFHHQRARARAALGIHDDALTEYAGAEAIAEGEHDPDKQGAAANNTAFCFLRMGDLEAAQENIDRAFVLWKDSFYLPQAHDTQAQIHLKAGRLGPAADSIRMALDLLGDRNEVWQKDFLATQERIECALLAALEVEHLSDWERIRINMVRRALSVANGSTGKAADLLGVTRHAIFSVVNTHKQDLEPYRKPKRVRRKSIIKQIER